MSHLALFLTWATVSAGFVLAVGAWRGGSWYRKQFRSGLT